MGHWRWSEPCNALVWLGVRKAAGQDLLPGFSQSLASSTSLGGQAPPAG